MPKPKLNPLVEERLSVASAERLWCQKCALYMHCKTPFIKPFVPAGWTRRMLLVGEAPGGDEDERSGRPFTGRAGKLLREVWQRAGYQDADVALVNAVRCRPRKNATPSMSAVRACRPFLLRAIRLLTPQLVVGLGGTALRALRNHGDANVTKARGRLLSCPGLEDLNIPCYVTYHPAAILHGATHLAAYIEEDLRVGSRPALTWPIDGIPAEGMDIVGIDTEWDAAGNILTVGAAGKTYAWAEEEAKAGFNISRKVVEQARVLCGHNLAQDVEKLASLDYPVKSRWLRGEDTLDSLLLSRMVDENVPRSGYSLENMLLGFVQVEPWKHRTEELLKRCHDMGQVPPDLRQERCRLDAWAARVAAKYFLKQLRDKLPLVRFTHRVAASLSRMTLAGAFIDPAIYSALSAEFAGIMGEKSGQLSTVAKEHGLEGFSPTNDSHVRILLYEKLGLPVENTTETGLPSVDKYTLQNLNHPVAELLRDFAKAEKLYSTNIRGLLDLFVATPHIVDVGDMPLLPFRINPLGARTGRRSSSAPNSQNWAKKVRRMVRSRWPGGKIGAFDYNKLEVLVLGKLANEDFLLETFTRGNGYLDIAKHMWGYACQEGTSEYRSVKSIVLGVHYNMQVPYMAENLWNLGVRFSADYEEHVAQTARLHAKYLRLIPRVVEYMARQEDRLRRSQQVESLTGRVRHLPTLRGDDRSHTYRHLLNQAINFPVQSLASDITGAALIDVEEALLDKYDMSYFDYVEMLNEANKKVLTNGNGGGIISTEQWKCSVPFNEVHDELTFDLHPAHIEEDTEIILEIMGKVPSLRRLVPDFDVPLSASVKKGVHWSDND